MPGIANDLNINQLGIQSFNNVNGVFNGVTLTAGPGITITNGNGQAGNPTISMANGIGDLHTDRFIVSPGGISDGANFTTIASAIAAAQGTGVNQTIFIQPGTYNENLTLIPGIDLAGFPSGFYNASGITIINGKLTMKATGTATISNLTLQTNGDYVVEITGSNAVNVVLKDCMISATSGGALHCTNTTGSINLFQCQGIQTGANTYFVATGGTIKAFNSVLTGTGNNASTFANSSLELDYTYFACPITTSGTGAVGLYKAQIICTNTTALTHGGSGNSIVMETRFESGSASAISIGATLPVIHSSVFSTNANAITGAGTLQYAFIAFYGSGSSSTVNTSTQTALATLI